MYPLSTNVMHAIPLTLVYEQESGLYVAGWLKRGPTGTIATTLFDAVETADKVLEDWDELAARPLDTSMDELLSGKRIRPVTFNDWKKIEAAEIQAGEQLGKPREKMTSLEEMYSVARSS